MQAHKQITIGKVNKVKINNLKIAKKLGVIGEEEFKAIVKEYFRLVELKVFISLVLKVGQ